jgi:polar amino acid transport system permease protein
MGYRFNFKVIIDNYDVLIGGLLRTLQFTVICIALGILVGFCICMIGRSKHKAIRILGISYVEFFRGTPVLVQLFWIFFCLPLIIGVEISNFYCSIIALTLFMGAITSESFRSALNAISKDQYDASSALGLSMFQGIRFVIFPQAIRLAIPTLLSNSVSLFKESSLVSAVGMVELMYVGQNLSNVTARPLEILTAVAFFYFAVAFPITRLVTLLEKRMLVTIAG